MERVIEHEHDDVVELGSVSEQTKGSVGGTNDSIGLHQQAGLSDD